MSQFGPLMVFPPSYYEACEPEFAVPEIDEPANPFAEVSAWEPPAPMITSPVCECGVELKGSELVALSCTVCQAFADVRRLTEPRLAA